jgi:hypothetical protein
MRTLFAMFLMSALAIAQTSSSTTSSSSTETKTAETKAADAKATETKSADPKDKKKKDKKKKDDKSSGAQDAIDTTKVFPERIANDVVGTVRDGLEGHSMRLMLSAFDGDKMDGYLSFEDQIENYFNRYEAFRVHFRVANVAIEGAKGVILVDAQLEQTPANGGTPARKNSQLRFEIELGKKGWRITDVRDRGFFS